MATDKKILTALTSPKNIEDRLITGAYMAARSEAPDYSWMNIIGAGVKAFKTEHDARVIADKTKRDKALEGIQGTIDEIYESGGSLSQEYFDQAYDYTEGLREEYLTALDSDDTKAQHQIKAKLNLFSTTIQNMKQGITESAGLWQDGDLINDKGFTAEQININASINGGNAVLGEDGSYKWNAIDIDGNPILDENGEQKYYTMEDLKGALPMKDSAGSETYLKANKSHIDNGQAWRDGDGSDFDFDVNHAKNMDLISTENDTYLQSWIWDDQTGVGGGSFADSLDKHPNFTSIFDAINYGGEGTVKNLTTIGLYDKTGDGLVDFRDFIEFDSPESKIFYSKQFDVNQNGKISDEELELITKNPDALKAIKEIAKNKLKDALTKTDHDNFDAGVTKSLIADFLTGRQEQMFYGKHKDYKLLVPGKDNPNVKFNKRYGTLTIDNQKITTLDAYLELGGSYSYLKDAGYYYDESTTPPKWKQRNPKSGFKSAKY